MSFINFARAHGLLIDESKLYASDFIKRCGTVDKPRSLNGSYLWDGQRGWIFDWAGEAKAIWYDDPNAKPWTDQEKRDWAAKRNKANADKDNSYIMAADRADILLRTAKMEQHPYLEIKGFADMQGYVMGGKLLIPMRNVITGKLQGFQEIYWDMPNRKYEKKMLHGMRAKNGVLIMGSKEAPETWFVEGYATGLSLHKALRSVGLNAAVVVCFSAVNMIQVADQVKGDRYVFADNDESKTGEKAAIDTGLPWTMADEVGMDANDMHDKLGLMSVVKKVMDLRKKVLTQETEHSV
jgi:putative DNA primase/helicase